MPLGGQDKRGSHQLSTRGAAIYPVTDAVEKRFTEVCNGADSAPRFKLVSGGSAPLPVIRYATIDLLNPSLTHHSGLPRRTVGTAETSYSHRVPAPTAIAGSVTVSSSANAVFGICVSG